MTRTRTGIGAALLSCVVFAAVAAPAISIHDPTRQFRDFEQAPPMLPRIIDADGGLRAPFVYPLQLVDRLERRYIEDRANPITLQWFSGGALVRTDEQQALWLPLGGDVLGRDVFARVIAGARLSLSVAAIATAGAMLIGALVGAVAGYRGGRLDDALMRTADFVLLLPAIYVVLALRATMPLVLTTGQVFWAIVGVLALVGWPYPARGVRAVIAAERHKEYAEAARAAGAGGVRILLRHLLPATGGFLASQATLLLPAFILAEATLSFVGLGFADPTASWGSMLQDAGRVSVITDAPWLLAPAFAIVISVLSVHLLIGASSAQTRRAPLS